MKYLKFLIKSILAGLMIGVGGTIYLALDNKIVGAFLFAIGLFIIVTKELNLYTGKIGYIFNNKLNYCLEVLITLVGNFIGTFLVGFALRFTRIYSVIGPKAQAICQIKLDDTLTSILLLSVFCGILMYLAVNGYKVMKDSFGKYAGVFLGVAVFILCSFEHCVANMYYFTIADMWNLQSFGYLMLMVLGNSIGGVLFPLSEKLIALCDKKSN